jgi:hypothetical protein
MRYYLDLTERPAVLGLTLLMCAPADQDALAAALHANVYPTFRRQPGLLECSFYRRLDQTDRLLVLHGWQSREAWERWIPQAGPLLETLTVGPVRGVRRFVWRPRGEVEERSAPA